MEELRGRRDKGQDRCVGREGFESVEEVLVAEVHAVKESDGKGCGW